MIRMNTVGKFKITDAFKSKDQQGILIGDILEGSVNIGNYLCIPTKLGDAILKILDIEKGLTISGVPFKGLLFEFNDKLALSEFKSLREKEVEIKE